MVNKICTKVTSLIVCILIVIASVCLSTLLLHHNGNKTSYIQSESKDMIASYEASYFHLDFYKQKDKIIINAYSDGKFDEPNQLVVPFEGEITKEDILVQWKTLGDKVVEQDSDGIIVANVIIEKNGKTICNENISLFEKGWKILNNVVGK